MEDVGGTRTAPEGTTYVTRPIDVYCTEFAEHGFHLVSATPLNLHYSRRVHSAIRRRLVPPTHREGQPLSAAVKAVLTLAIGITRLMDESRPDTEDLTKMVFVRNQHAA